MPSEIDIVCIATSQRTAREQQKCELMAHALIICYTDLISTVNNAGEVTPYVGLSLGRNEDAMFVPLINLIFEE